MGFKPGMKTALSTLCLFRPHHPHLPRPQQEQQEAARSPGPCKHLRTRGRGQGAETQRPRPPSKREEGGRGGGGFPGRVGCEPQHLTSPRGPPPHSWRLPATPCVPSGHQHPPAFDGIKKPDPICRAADLDQVITGHLQQVSTWAGTWGHL